MKRFLLLALVLCTYSMATPPTALTVQTVSEASALVADQSCDNTNGNYAPNPNGDLAFIVYNSDESNSATVTFTAQATSVATKGYGPMTKANLAVSLSTGQRKIVGPFPSAAWNDVSGRVQMTFGGSGASSVKVTPFRVPR